MNVIYSVKDYVTNVFDLQQATASGAIDIVAVQHENGDVQCTPFHVHFGRVEPRNKAEKTVTLIVNGIVVPDVHMKLGAAGEAFFVDSVETPVDDDYRTSPLVSPSASPVPTGKTLSTVDTSPSTVPVTVEAKEIVTSLPPSEPTVETEKKNLKDTSSQNVEPAEWHDAYRLVSNARRAPLHREASAPAERLKWGWGALPIVHAASMGDLAGHAEETLEDDDGTYPMVKSASVYFDAVEAENLQTNSYVSDHPCMSLCGKLLDAAQTREEAHTIFSEHIITSESFKENAASYLQNPDLRFLIDGKICPFDTDLQAFLVSRVLFPSSQPPPLTCSWAESVRRRQSERQEPSFWFGDLEEDENDKEQPEDEVDSRSTTTTNEGDKPSRRWFQWFPRSSSAGSESPQVGSTFQPVEPVPMSPSIEPNDSPVFYRKTLQPSQDQLARMGFHHGTNDIEFVVSTFSGSQRVSAKLYLWSITEKIIIAEIDGAITRTPTGRRLSGLLASKDKDTAGVHKGAIEFYARAARNGYRIVYLTSRGLSQADLIHAMLRGSSGSRDQALPNGPVLLSPDRLLEDDGEDATNVSRDFKFEALNGIRTLFPDDVNPFYAAFGKTYADSVVFTQVGVFPGKVFLVDEGDGRLRHRSMMNYQESYFSLLGLVDKMFPPICSPSPRYPSRQGSRESLEHISMSSSLTSSSSLPSSPRSFAPPMSPPSSMKRVFTATEEFVSDVLSSTVRTRSMGDEAFNDVNFWRIKPGCI